MNQLNSKQQRHGPWVIQNYNGTLIAKGEYMNGFRIGFWCQYYTVNRINRNRTNAVKEFFL